MMDDGRDDGKSAESSGDMTDENPVVMPDVEENPSLADGEKAEASGEQRKSKRTPRPSSPFLLLADPKPSRESSIPPEPPVTKNERPSFVPEKSDTAVVISPICRVGNEADEEEEEIPRETKPAHAVWSTQAKLKKGNSAEANHSTTRADSPPAAEAELSEDDVEEIADIEVDVDNGFEVEPEVEIDVDEGMTDVDRPAIALAEEPIEVDEGPTEEIANGAVQDHMITEEIDAVITEEVAIEPVTQVDAKVEPGDDDEILDLRQEFMVDEAQATAEVDNDEVEAAVVVEVEEPSDRMDTDSAPPPVPTEDGPGMDMGTPEAVFDMVPESTEPSVVPEPSAVPEPSSPVHQPSAPPPTPIPLSMEDGDVEMVEEEDTEEIDLSAAEEITARERPQALIDAGGSPSLGKRPVPPASRQPRMQRRRKRKREWWTEIFDDDYLSVLPENTPRNIRREVDFLEKTLDVPKGSLILDLACGQGIHAVGLAQRGYRIVGVDLSLAMLARAGELAQEEGQKINFIHGDMCDLGFNQTFEAVFCVGTSFGYFDDQTNAKVLDGIHRALKSGGRLLLEVTNRDHAITEQPNLTWFEGSGSVCMEETDFNYINSRLYMTRQVIVNDSGRQVKHEFSIRLYSLHELGNLLHNAGFRVAKVAGHMATPGAFFGADSARMIILAERRS